MKGKSEEMKWSRERYRILFEMVKDAIFMINVDGKIIDVNQSWLELFGYRSKKEVLELDLARDIYANPEDRKRLLELLEKEKFVKDYEIEAKRRDGAKIIVSLSDQVIQDEKGRAVGYVGMIRDVTKTREYERRLEEYSVRLEWEVQERTRELKESEEKYRRLFEGSKDALYITTKEGKFVDLNQATVDLFGYAGKEELKKIESTSQLYLNPEDRKKMQEIMSKQGYLKDMEQELKRKDGTKIYALVTGIVRRDDGGNVISYEGMIKDITEIRRTQERLRESEEMFRTLVTSAPIGLSIIAKDGAYEYVNPKFVEMFGYAPEDVPTGKKWFEKAYPDQAYRRKVIASWIEDLQGERVGETRPRVFTVTCKDGSEKEIFFRPVSLTDGRQLVMYEDITERKRAEEASQREKRAVEVVAKIGRIISSTLEIDKVYELFAEEVGKAIPFDRIAINIPYPGRGTVSTAYIAGHDVPGRRPGDVIPLAGSLTEEAMRKRAGLLIQTEEVDGVLGRLPGLSPTFKVGFRSLMAVPLISQDRVIGVLHLRSFKPNAYTEEDVTLAESIGNQIAGAIASSELYAERMRAEKELKQSEERYRSLVEDINDGYFIVQDKRFVYINQALANLTGNSKEVILGSEYQKFFPQKYLERLAKDDLKRRRDRGQNEFEISREGGENLVLEIRSRIIEYNGRPAIAGICKDITERKKAETSLEEKVEELERWYQLTVDREVKMTQLKTRIQELEFELKHKGENPNAK